MQLSFRLKMTISASFCYFAQYESDGPWVCCSSLTLHWTVHLKEDSDRNSTHFHATRLIFVQLSFFNPKICLSIDIGLVLVTIEARQGHYLPTQRGGLDTDEHGGGYCWYAPLNWTSKELMVSQVGRLLWQGLVSSCLCPGVLSAWSALSHV